MKIEFNLTNILIGIIVLFIIIFIISRVSMQKKLDKAEDKIAILQAANDSVYNNNLYIISYYESRIRMIDSIYQKSLESNEEEIQHYWDSVYNVLISSDTTYDFLTEYFSELGSKKRKRSILF